MISIRSQFQVAGFAQFQHLLDKPYEALDPMTNDDVTERFWVIESEEWTARLTSRASQMFYNDQAAAETAIEYAKQHVMRVAQSTPEKLPNDAVLWTALVNKMIDYSKKIYGARRSPQFVASMGRVWKAVFNLLCLRQVDPTSITLFRVQEVLGEGMDALDGESRERRQQDINLAVSEIPRRHQDCRKPKAPLRASIIPAIDEDEPLSALSVSEDALTNENESDDIGAELDEEHIGHVLGILDHLLSGAALETESSLTETQRSSLLRLRTTLDLGDHERLLLRLVYQEGLSARAAANRLPGEDGSPPSSSDASVRRTQRMLTRIHEKLKRTFSEAGLASIGELLTGEVE